MLSFRPGADKQNGARGKGRNMRHANVMDWEARLKAVFDRIDHALEDKYGDRFPLHPARPARGATSNPEHDGLFNLGAVFTAGYGSQTGPGYVVEVHFSTLARVPEAWRERLAAEVVEQLRAELPRAFPGRDLRVTRDGPVYKIHGDLRLGQV